MELSIDTFSCISWMSWARIYNQRRMFLFKSKNFKNKCASSYLKLSDSVIGSWWWTTCQLILDKRLWNQRNAHLRLQRMVVVTSKNMHSSSLPSSVCPNAVSLIHRSRHNFWIQLHWFLTPLSFRTNQQTNYDWIVVCEISDIYTNAVRPAPVPNACEHFVFRFRKDHREHPVRICFWCCFN